MKVKELLSRVRLPEFKTVIIQNTNGVPRVGGHVKLNEFIESDAHELEMEVVEFDITPTFRQIVSITVKSEVRR